MDIITAKRVRRFPKYGKWRSSTRKRLLSQENACCEYCASKEDLTIHHIYALNDLLIQHSITTREEAYECDALWNTENISVLCDRCHKLVHEISQAA